LRKSKPTQHKRARERARQEKQRDKAARREEAKARRAEQPPPPPGIDPDIAGIVPGPQPPLWLFEEEEAAEAADSEDEESGEE
jgi:hypothetical protein